MSMILDYKVDGKPWARLRYDQAKIVRKDGPSTADTTAEEFSSLLGSTTGANSEPLGGRKA